jgi:hypothetical protein
MATVKSLIEQLQLLDPEDTILFQYLTSEFADGYHEHEFAELVEYLDDNSSFADDSASMFYSWLQEAESVIEEERERED